MRILIAFTLIWSVTAFAGEVSRQEAAGIIDEMVRSNMISMEEAAKAKARLQTMSATEWSALNKDAEKKAAEHEGRVPASVSNTDLAAEQMDAIESDLKKIAPHTVVNPTEVQATEVQATYVEETKVEHVTVPQVEVPQTVVEETQVSETFVPQT